jgi:hypothetical protein
MNSLEESESFYLPTKLHNGTNQKTVMSSASSIRMFPLYYVIYILEVLQTENCDGGFEIHTVVTVNITVVWVVSLCSSERAWRFGGTYHLHLQGGIVSQ